MVSISPRRKRFLRDAALSTALLAVPMALYRAYVEPSFLQIPGLVLYFPLMVVYVLFGGETENQFGPSLLHIGLYLVALGLLVATVAYFLRRS